MAVGSVTYRVTTWILAQVSLNLYPSPLSSMIGRMGMCRSIAKGSSRLLALFSFSRKVVVTANTNSCISPMISSNSLCSSSLPGIRDGSGSYQTAQSEISRMSSESRGNAPAKSSGWQAKYTLGLPWGSPISFVLYFRSILTSFPKRGAS